MKKKKDIKFKHRKECLSHSFCYKDKLLKDIKNVFFWSAKKNCTWWISLQISGHPPKQHFPSASGILQKWPENRCGDCAPDAAEGPPLATMPSSSSSLPEVSTDAGAASNEGQAKTAAANNPFARPGSNSSESESESDDEIVVDNPFAVLGGETSDSESNGSDT